ncbi:MAG: hypothetical protein GWP05_00605 [Anaerolineaceae bacterium]|nr:hypothetical protein [Anaerolineaceae bacterium]
MNYKYAAWTLVVLAIILGYMALATYISPQAPRQTVAAEEAEGKPSESAENTATTDKPDAHHASLMTTATTIGLIVLAVALTFVLARLQRRRKEAYRKAARESKEEARQATRNSRDLDDS